MASGAGIIEAGIGGLLILFSPQLGRYAAFRWRREQLPAETLARWVLAVVGLVVMVGGITQLT